MLIKENYRFSLKFQIPNLNKTPNSLFSTKNNVRNLTSKKTVFTEIFRLLRPYQN